jgi:hypothetical protein
MKNKKIRDFIAISFFVCLIGIGHSINGNSVAADEIKDLERKLEYLKQKKILDAQLQNIQLKLKKLDDDYSDVKKSTSTRNVTKKVAKPKKISSNTITSLWVIKSLVKSNGGVALKGCCGGNQTFKFSKEGANWEAMNESNSKWSVVKLGADKTFTMEDFPSNWVINGTWTFSGKKGSECKILHEGKSLTMLWKC